MEPRSYLWLHDCCSSELVGSAEVATRMSLSCPCESIASSYKIRITIGGWEKKRSAQPGIQAQRPRTRTARTTRQINGAIFCGGQPYF